MYLYEDIVNFETHILWNGFNPLSSSQLGTNIVQDIKLSTVYEGNKRGFVLKELTVSERKKNASNYNNNVIYAVIETCTGCYRNSAKENILSWLPATNSG